MAPSFWYWLILILMIVFSVWGYVPTPPHPWYRSRAWHFWLFVLLVILGWRAFGNPFTALVN